MEPQWMITFWSKEENMVEIERCYSWKEVERAINYYTPEMIFSIVKIQP